ncbi:hypothetical protein ACLKA7_007780 [Drosophila subpalustris]
MVNEETADEERVEHQVPSPAMELVATDEWVSEDEEMAGGRRVEHPVPSPAMEQVAADEWLVEDEEMADGQQVEHPVPSPAMKDVVADEWSVEDEEPADGQPADHPVRPPVRETVAADGELMEDADRQRLPSDIPIFSARAPTARVDRPDSPPASENSGEAEPAAEAGAKEKGGARKFWEQFGSRELEVDPCSTFPRISIRFKPGVINNARLKRGKNEVKSAPPSQPPNTPKKSRHKASHKRGGRDTSPKVTTQSVSAARVVVHEEDRSVAELMPPEDELLRAGSNIPTQITHTERLFRDMEDMLDGWKPDLDEVSGEVAVPEATLLPLIPRDWRIFPGGTVLTEPVIRMLRREVVRRQRPYRRTRFRVVEGDAEFNVTITSDGAVTVTLLMKGGGRKLRGKESKSCGELRDRHQRVARDWLETDDREAKECRRRELARQQR